MNYFITGSSGLLGNTLIKNLPDHKITCLLHKKKLNLKINNTKILIGDILDQEFIIKSTKGADIIIHAAGAINESRSINYYNVNYLGTKNIVKATTINKVKLLIYISSWAVNPHGGDYAKSKLLAEQEVKKTANYLIIRPADIYSKTKSHILNLIKLIDKNRFIPIIDKGDYKVSPVYVDDLSKAITFLINNYSKSNTYTVTGPKIYTFLEIVKLIMKIKKIKKPIISLPGSLLFPLITLSDYLNIELPLNREKYRRLLAEKKVFNQFNFQKAGINPLDFEYALKKYLIKL